MGEDKNRPKSHSKSIVLIGTGPVSLLKAYLLAKENPKHSIHLIDSNSRIGGAWYSEKSPKGAEIECGCHIWSYVPEVYSYIEKELEIPLDFIDPTPKFIGKKVQTPYSTKNLIDSYKYILKNLLTFRWRRILHIKNDPRYYFKLFGKRNKYPGKGSPELIHSLTERLQQMENVRFTVGIRISEIHLGDSVELIATDNQVIRCDKCVITSVSEISIITKGDVKINIKQDRVDYIHFLICLNKPLLKKISYWRLIDDPVIHRITDISYQTDDEHLLLIGIKSDPFHNKTEGELLRHVIKVLTDYRLIDESHHIDLIKTHVFPTWYIEDAIRTKIKALGEDIELIHSTDLMHGFYRLLETRWLTP